MNHCEDNKMTKELVRQEIRRRMASVYEPKQKKPSTQDALEVSNLRDDVFDD